MFSYIILEQYYQGSQFKIDLPLEVRIKNAALQYQVNV